ncbi:MAG: acyltransferase family protein [Alphaproteobacteria bacterium]
MRRIAFLDYLRILSVSLVILQHYKFFLNQNDEIKLSLIYATGNFGVSIFLLISGFIITDIVSKYGNIKDFLFARFLRIYPLFLLAFFIYYFLLETNPETSFSNILLQLILPIADFSSSYTLIAVEWTLRVEFLFYIVVAIMFFSHNLNITKIFLLQIFNAFFLFFWYEKNNFNLYVFICLANLNYIFIGSIIYLHFNNNPKNLKNLAILIVSIFITHLAFFKAYNYDFLLYFTGFCALIIFLLCFAFRDRFRNFQIIRICSDLTFPLYLFHNFFYNLIFKNNFYNIIALVLFSYLIHKLIEEKIAKFKNKIIKKI